MTLNELKNQFPAAPEYLTQIFLIERDNGTVPNARLADRLGVSRPAVSQAVGRLKKLNLVDQDRYGAIGLSAEGRLIAEKVVRRHFLLEHLLVSIEFPWEKADTEAGLLQDSLSDELTEYLASRLGNPQVCPHGNPFPGAEVERKYLEAPSLIEAEEGQKLKVIRITEEGEMTEGMLSFCINQGIVPGKILTVKQKSQEEMLCTDESSTLAIPAEFVSFIRWDSP